MPDTRKNNLYTTRPNGDLKKSVYNLLDAAGLEVALQGRGTVLLKPNLVGTHAPPVTTPVGLVSAIADYVRERRPEAEVLVGDGTGSVEYETERCFTELGYTELSGKGIRLVDLNTEPLVRIEDPANPRRPEFFMPKVVMDSFLISVPVLKAHTLAGVTLTMKNMIGVAPPAHYQADGRWKKSSFHAAMHESIFDLNRYRTPDFTVLDAREGMKDAHLWGDTLRPAPGLVAAAFDPVTADAYGSTLLERDPEKIDHIKWADGVLGSIRPGSVEGVR